MKNYQSRTVSSIDKVKDQGYEMESYLRSLGFEDTKLVDKNEIMNQDNENVRNIIEDIIQLTQINKERIKD